MDSTPLTGASSPETDPQAFPLALLYEALRGLFDPRRGQGKRSSLALILCLVVLAKLVGQKTLSGATEWIRHRASALAERFALCREKMLCHMTDWNRSLSLKQAPPRRMLYLVRAHGGRENLLHWRGDATLGEDACQTRTGRFLASSLSSIARFSA